MYDYDNWEDSDKILIVLIRYGLDIFMVYMQTAKIQNSKTFLRFWTPGT